MTKHPAQSQPGEHNPSAKLTGYDVQMIRALRRDGMSTCAIAIKFEVSQRQVQRILRGDRWS